VKAAAVAAWDGPAGEKRLVAYCVAGEGTVPQAGALRDFLRDRLPDAMVPSAIVLVDALPQTPSGKVDRRALPPPDPATADGQPPFTAPRDDVEAALVRIWEDVLGIDGVSVTSDFFDLGGHSLQALRIVDAIRERFGLKLPLSALLHHPTVERLARAVAEPGALAGGEAVPAPIVAMHTDGRKPPFFFLHAALFGDALYASQLGRYLGPDQPFYALSPLGLDGGPIPSSVEEIAAAYAQQIRRLHAKGPYQLGAFCRSGPIAVELAAQLRADGESVGVVVLIDSSITNVGFFARAVGRSIDALAHACGWPAYRRTAMFLAIKRRFGAEMHSIFPEAQSTLAERVRQHYNRAAHAYVPRCSDLPLVHLWTQARGPDARWRRVSTRLLERMIPGDHESCVTEHLRITSLVLSSFLASL
jgi:thioesterase domain-containing protein/acyl carrier protein